MRLPPKLSEAEFTRQVLDLAALHNWRTAHFRPGMTAKGRWVTAVAGQGKGFPDIFAVHPTRGLLAAELKVGRNKLTPEQCEWIDALEAAGVPVYCWRPADWEAIVSVLKGEGKS